MTNFSIQNGFLFVLHYLHQEILNSSNSEIKNTSNLQEPMYCRSSFDIQQYLFHNAHFSASIPDIDKVIVQLT